MNGHSQEPPIRVPHASEVGIPQGNRIIESGVGPLGGPVTPPNRVHRHGRLPSLECAGKADTLASSGGAANLGSMHRLTRFSYLSAWEAHCLPLTFYFDRAAIPICSGVTRLPHDVSHSRQTRTLGSPDVLQDLRPGSEHSFLVFFSKANVGSFHHLLEGVFRAVAQVRVGP